ncbi:cysteine hydrolase family protein [soil metagenome]
MNKRAILIIDIQNDFTGNYAKMPVDKNQAAQMITNLNKLIDNTDTSKTEIIYIGNEYSKWNFLNIFRNFAAIKGMNGTNIDQRLHVVNKIYFPKNKGNAFTNPNLNSYLISKNVDEIFIGGLYAEACIYETVKGGLSQNYKVNILTDCIATKSNEQREKAIEKYKKPGAKNIKSETM